MVGMQNVLDEIAGYNASTKGKYWAEEKKKADAATNIREEGLQNCSPRGGRGTPLDYSSDESCDLESQDITNTKLVSGCSDVEVISEKNSPAVRDSTESVSNNPPSSGKRRENSDASEMDNYAGGSSSKGRTNDEGVSLLRLKTKASLCETVVCLLFFLIVFSQCRTKSRYENRVPGLRKFFVGVNSYHRPQSSATDRPYVVCVSSLS